MKKCERVLAVALGGGQEREVDGQRLRALGRAASESDLAEDDGQTQGLLGVVVGLGMPSKSRQVKRLGAS